MSTVKEKENKQAPLTPEQEKLFFDNVDFVKSIAKKHTQDNRPNLLDDHIQQGMIGLLKAVRSFDKSKGIEFRSYARLLIRGAIIDFIRMDGHAHIVRTPKSTLSSKEFQRGIDEIEQKHQRPFRGQGDYFELSLITGANILNIERAIKLRSEYRSLNTTPGKRDRNQDIPDLSTPPSEKSLREKWNNIAIRKELQKMMQTPKEQQMAELWQALGFDTIFPKDAGVTVSRISQLKTKIRSQAARSGPLYQMAQEHGIHPQNLF